MDSQLGAIVLLLALLCAALLYLYWLHIPRPSQRPQVLRPNMELARTEETVLLIDKTTGLVCASAHIPVTSEVRITWIAHRDEYQLREVMPDGKSELRATYRVPH